MGELKCLHCGGPYCDLEKKQEDFDKTVCHYYCNSCKQRFIINYTKPAATGRWLLTFTIRAGEGILEFYRDIDGSIYYREKYNYYDEVLRKSYSEFTVRRNTPMIYTNVVGSWEVVLRNEYHSHLSLSEIEMSQELTQEALNNPAMRAIYLGNNRFNLTINNEQLRGDVCQWLRSTLHAHDFGNKSASGCYIATSVYGSYDCPQVWTLRRFRDNSLASTWYGRTFVRVYYAISPSLVEWFGNTVWFRKLWRHYLDKLVVWLQRRGVEATPYRDIKW